MVVRTCRERLISSPSSAGRLEIVIIVTACQARLFWNNQGEEKCLPVSECQWFPGGNQAFESPAGLDKGERSPLSPTWQPSCSCKNFFDTGMSAILRSFNPRQIHKGRYVQNLDSFAFGSHNSLVFPVAEQAAHREEGCSGQLRQVPL